jgi:hypothetical protein
MGHGLTLTIQTSASTEYVRPDRVGAGFAAPFRSRFERLTN